tara:strand:- start:1626 stop:2048 length:423 start_codon:yes stop_codon:yes gene_type:complete
MRLSLICEDSSSDLAIKIAELIDDGDSYVHYDNLSDLEDETFTAEFLTNDAGISKNDIESAWGAGLLVGAEGGEYKLSDKMIGMLRAKEDERAEEDESPDSGEKGKRGKKREPRGVLDKIMSGAPGYNQIKGAFRELQGK